MKITIAKISTSGKTACGMIRTCEWSMNAQPVYIPNNGYAKGDVIEVPDDVRIIEWVGHATKDGIPLMTLSR